MDALDTKLFPGDKVELTYQLIQGGTWWVAYQVGKIEDRLELDPRTALEAYEYDEQFQTVMFRVRMLTTPRQTSEEMQLAGMLPWLLVSAVAGFVMHATWTWLYEPPEAKVIREQRQTAEYVEQVTKDPDLTDEQKEEIIGVATTVPDVTETLSDKVAVSATAMVVAAVVIYFLTRG